MHRNTSHHIHRGNIEDRRRRRAWVLRTFGNGTACLCIHGCGTVLDNRTLEIDRIIPGESYRHENIQPSCHNCNHRRGDNPDWVYTPIAEDYEDSWGVEF